MYVYWSISQIYIKVSIQVYRYMYVYCEPKYTIMYKSY